MVSIIILCKVCGKEFKVKKCRQKTAKFCSIKCTHLAYKGKGNPCWRNGKIKVKCENCGEVFTIFKCKLLYGRGKFCSKKCAKIGMSKRFAGNKTKSSLGYILIVMPNHPCKDKNNKVYEHRLVMENKLDRFLKSGEEIHHINENRADNRIENLQVLSKVEHQKLHKNFKKG